MLGLVYAGLQGLHWYGFEGFIPGLQIESMILIVTLLSLIRFNVGGDKQLEECIELD